MLDAFVAKYGVILAATIIVLILLCAYSGIALYRLSTVKVGYGGHDRYHKYYKYDYLCSCRQQHSKEKRILRIIFYLSFIWLSIIALVIHHNFFLDLAFSALGGAFIHLKTLRSPKSIADV